MISLTLVGGPFVSQGNHPLSQVHTASRWQVDTLAGDFSAPLWDSGVDTVNLLSITTPVMFDSAPYRARVAYIDGLELETWSDPSYVNSCDEGLRVTFFEDDDVTPILGELEDDGVTVLIGSFHTSPNCLRPYLKMPDELGDARVNFRTGSAVIGGINIEIVDFPTDPADPYTGIVTSIIDKLPYCRCLVERYINGWKTIADGVVYSFTLDRRIVTYNFELHDIREREVDRALFVRNETMAVFPIPGPVSGYFKSQDGGYYIEPVPPDQGVFHLVGASDDAGRSWGWVDSQLGAVAYEKSVFQKYIPLGFAESGALQLIGGSDWSRFPHITVRWAPGTGLPDPDDYIYLRDMHAPPGVGIAFFALGNSGHAESDHLWYAGVVRVVLEGPTASLPADGATVRFQVLSADVVSEDAPFYFEGTFGELLKNIYDGAYSLEPPRIRYDATAMADFVANTPTARLVKTEPVSDMRKWVEENIYKPLGAAPLIDENGRVRPTVSHTPAEGETLPVLDDDVLQIVEMWEYRGEDAVSQIVFNYKREYITTEDGERFLNSRDVQIVHRNPASRANIPLEYSPETVRAIGASDGSAAGGIDAEVGSILAAARAADFLFRLPNGSQTIKAKGRLDSVALEDARVGDWRALQVAYLPDTTQLVRNLNRVVQIVAMTPRTDGWCDLTLLDGGPNATPPGGAAADPPAYDADGRVSIEVTTVPAGSRVRVEYAFAVTEPAAGDAAWQLLGVVEAPTVLKTPVVPDGVSVFTRFRTEKNDTRPSDWSAADTAGTSTTMIVLAAAVSIDQTTGVPTVTWTANAATIGVRVYYDDHVQGTAPTYGGTYVDADATDGTVDLPAVTLDADPSRELSVLVEPWDHFPISGASGVARSVAQTYGADEVVVTTTGKVPFIKANGVRSDIALV